MLVCGSLPTSTQYSGTVRVQSHPCQQMETPAKEESTSGNSAIHPLSSLGVRGSRGVDTIHTKICLSFFFF